MKQVVLIADDDERLRRLLCAALQPEGYETVVAEDGVQAVELARSARPGLMLLDIQIPVLDGFGVMRVLKADPDTRSIPAIAVTGMDMSGEMERLRSAGFAGFLCKPVGVAELRAAVAGHFGRGA